MKPDNKMYTDTQLTGFDRLAQKLAAISVDRRPQIDRDLALIVTGMEMQRSVQVTQTAQPQTVRPSS